MKIASQDGFDLDNNASLAQQYNMDVKKGLNEIAAVKQAKKYEEEKLSSLSAKEQELEAKLVSETQKKYLDKLNNLKTQIELREQARAKQEAKDAKKKEAELKQIEELKKDLAEIENASKKGKNRR
jgi:Mg2+ and Co2+ transporter CorA